MVVERVRRMSVEDFLDFAEQSEEWYEYIDGDLYPMTTPTFRHNVISFNIASRLGMLLADQNCQALGMGQGIRVAETRFLIPDVCLVCGEPLLEAASRILLNPVLVAEVTSPTTINLDHGAKRDYYFNAPSIETYLIVDQHRVFVESNTRSAAGWRRDVFDSLDDVIPLERLGCALPLREIYQTISFVDGAASGASDSN